MRNDRLIGGVWKLRMRFTLIIGDGIYTRVDLVPV